MFYSSNVPVMSLRMGYECHWTRGMTSMLSCRSNPNLGNFMICVKKIQLSRAKPGNPASSI